MISYRVLIKNISKLFFALSKNYQRGLILFFYLFDLFEGLLLISISCNNFWYGSNKSFKIIDNIDLESIQILNFSLITYEIDYNWQFKY